MIDPVSAHGVRPPEELYDREPVDMGPGEVMPEDQERFEAALGVSGAAAPGDGSEMRVAEAGSGGDWIVQPSGAEAQATPPPTLGDAILDSLEHLRGSWRETMSDIQQLAENPKLDLNEMMKLQFQVQHTAVVTTMVLNEVKTIDQEVNKLLTAN